MKKITSSANKSIVWVKKILKQPKKFNPQKLVVVETKKVFLTALETIQKKDVISIFVDNQFYAKNKNWLYQFDNCTNICSQKIIESISYLKTPDGLIAIIKPLHKKINIKKNCNFLALYNLQNPTNLGAIIRSSLAFGINGIFLIGNCCNLYHHETIRSSMGYVFKIEYEQFNNFEYFYSYIKQNNLNLIALDNNNKAILLQNYKIKTNNCFIVGNEGNGLPDNILNKVKTIVKIDLCNKVESLNAAIAASIVAFYLKNENN